MYTLALIEADGNCKELWAFLLRRYKHDLGPFPGNLGMYLARTHPLGQYLIKAYFKFGFKLWLWSFSPSVELTVPCYDIPKTRT